jgi:hypothetical protein
MHFGVLGSIDLLNQLSLNERLDGAIQGSRTETKTPPGLSLNLPHDCIPVKVALGQSKHDLERGGGQRIKSSLWHRSSMIDISMNDCTAEFSGLSTDFASLLTGYWRDGLEVDVVWRKAAPEGAD